MTTRIDFQHPNIVLILRTMRADHRWTVHEFKALLGGNRNVSYRAIRFLRSVSLLYICDWRRVQAGRPVYALGALPDMPKPSRLPGAATQRAYYKREQMKKRAQVFDMGRKAGTAPRPKF